jgi:hypothetical protein
MLAFQDKTTSFSQTTSLGTQWLWEPPQLEEVERCIDFLESVCSAFC